MIEEEGRGGDDADGEEGADEAGSPEVEIKVEARVEAGVGSGMDACLGMTNGSGK